MWAGTEYDFYLRELGDQTIVKSIRMRPRVALEKLPHLWLGRTSPGRDHSPPECGAAHDAAGKELSTRSAQMFNKYVLTILSFNKYFPNKNRGIQEPRVLGRKKRPKGN